MPRTLLLDDDTDAISIAEVGPGHELVATRDLRAGEVLRASDVGLRSGAPDSALTTLIEGIRLLVFDFDGVLTDGAVYVSEDGRESVRCDRSDGLGLERLRELGVATLILSTETNPVVSARAAKLKMPCIQGQGKKLDALLAYAQAQEIPLHQVAYLGNDLNDVECLKAVGLPMVVADAWPDVKRLARHSTQRLGGRGAVREICDLFCATLRTTRAH